MRSSRLELGLLLAGLVFTTPLTALAQEPDAATRSAARQLGNTGVQAYQAGDYATAHEKLDKAYRVLKVPSLGLWSARSQVKTGRLVEASERYLEVTRLPVTSGEAAVQKQAQVDAEAELRALLPTIPSVVVQIEGAAPAEIALVIDGVRVTSDLIGEARPINPGTHLVEAWRGPERAALEVVLAVSEKKTAPLRFTPTGPGVVPTPAPQPVTPTGSVAPVAGTDTTGSSSMNLTPSGPTTAQVKNPVRTVAWVLVGAGAVGLSGWALTGATAAAKKSELDKNERCRDNRCLASEQGAVDSYQAWRTASSVTFFVGAGLAACGVVLVLASSPTKEAQVALQVAPGFATLRGTF